MKKLICAAAALGMVAGVASTASALDLTVAGQYFVQGNYFSNAQGEDNANGTQSMNPYDDEAGSMSGWNHTFMFKPTLKVNDKITVKADIRFLKDTDWGVSAANDDTNKGIGSTRSSDIHKIYMEYMSPIGKIRVGRTPAQAWMGAFLNNPTNADRLYLFPKMSKPWSSYVFYQKAVENDWYDGDNDSDFDVYEGSIIYTTKETKAALGYDLFNNNTNDLYDKQHHRAKGFLKQSFMTDWWVEAEFSYDFGDWRDWDNSALQDEDIDTLAAAVAVGTSIDNLKITALFIYASGDDDLRAGQDQEAAMQVAVSGGGGLGDGFNPYYILTGDHTGMLNDDEYHADPRMTRAGLFSIGVMADLAISDKLTLHGAVAIAEAAEGDFTDALGNKVSISDEYGWEVDLGASYKLLDNLTYKVEAGYMAVDDFFADWSDIDSATTDEDDLYLISHTLTMKF
jgi:hypothetical protein